MTTSRIPVAVISNGPDTLEAADMLARELGLPRCVPPCAAYPYILKYNTDHSLSRLELCATRKDAPGPIYVDFLTGALGFRIRHGTANKELLARAIGLKGFNLPTLLDATAGLGRDAFILARWGCRVCLVERSPIIGALLRDGLVRASANDNTRDIVERMQLLVGDAALIMDKITEHERPDVVYLDPMYPHRSKSALVKKEMRLLRMLVGEDLDAPQLLDAALRTARKRVVVKRPRVASALPGIVPSHSLLGGTTRFDVYLRHLTSIKGKISG
jgi:16S rRNA (guanine1516-N2)-methyltransferase